VTAQRALDHAGVNYVGIRGARCQGTDRTGLAVIEGLDIAAGEQPGQLNLPV
jgi:hypothetical protein